MDKREIKEQVKSLLATGTKKKEVFDLLTGKGIKDSQLAYIIASYADPRAIEEHYVQRKILLILIYIQVVIAFFMGFGIGMKLGGNAGWYFGIAIALFVWLFAYGFHRNNAGAYNAFIMLSIVQLPKLIEAIAKSPTSGIIGAAISLALFLFVWNLRAKLFPDFVFTTPRRKSGTYVFVDQ